MFIDRLLEFADIKGEQPELGWTRLSISEIQQAVAFKIDNVGSYYWQNSRNDWDIVRDFPNVAPVYPNMWLEWTLPQNAEVCISGEKRLQEESCTWGNHIFSLELSQQDVMPSILLTGGEAMASELKNIVNFRSDIKWISTSAEFVEDRLHAKPFLTQLMTWWVCTDGQRWLPQIANGKYLYPLKFPNTRVGNLFRELKCSGKVDMGEQANVPSLALSFMHCKNVEVKVLENSDKLQRARHHRGKRPLVDYHVLEIKPMVKVLKEQGQSETQGLQRALHICRGHFKDFTDKGLFGKYHGLYWWDSQVRGKATKGITLKDYKVSLGVEGGHRPPLN